MTRTLIYIENQLIDLYPNTVVTTNYQAIDIGDIKTRRVTHTNKFKVPKTPNNNVIFQFASVEHSTTALPYRKLSAKIIVLGVDLIPNATAIINEAGAFYDILVISSVVNFFDSIKGQNVDDLDFEVYETLDDTYIDSIRESTDLFSAPVIDFGTFFPSAQTLQNTDFEDGLTGWSNNGGGVQWEYNDTFPLVTYQNILSYFDSNTDVYTALLSQGYKLFKGFTYRIQFTFDTESTGTLEVFTVTVSLRKNLTRFDFTPISNTADNTYSMDETFVADQDYDFLEILAECVISNPGDDKRIILKGFTITDISGDINVKAQYYFPLISYSQVIEKIVTNAGYTLSIPSDPDFYEKLFISFSKDQYKYPERLINKMDFNASAAGTQVITANSTTKQEILFPSINSSGEYGWYDGQHTYAPQNIGYNVSIVAKCKIVIDVTIAGSDEVSFYFPEDGVTDSLLETVTSSGTYVFLFESDNIDAGLSAFAFKLRCNRSSGSGSNTVEILEGQFWSEVSNTPSGVVNLSAVVLPTIDQKVFFSDFLYRMGLLFKEQNNVISLKSIEAIIQDRANAVDWTSKRVSQEDTSSFKSDYAQENVFSDIIDDDFIVKDQYSSIDIDNENLEPSREYYTSIMSSCQQNFNNLMPVCRIPIFDLVNSPNDLGSYQANPRLFYLRTEKDTDSEVKYNDVVKSTFLVAVYNDQEIPYNTTWKYFLNNYYSGLSTSLQRFKLIKRSYMLTEIDINAIDPFKLMHDNGSYYIINKIPGFIHGKVTAVELFKII